MVKSKAIGVIVIIVTIIAVYALSQGQEDVSNEESVESVQDSSVSISDSVTLSQNNPDYEVDEEGNKRYTITVGDSPVLED